MFRLVEVVEEGRRRPLTRLAASMVAVDHVRSSARFFARMVVWAVRRALVVRAETVARVGPAKWLARLAATAARQEQHLWVRLAPTEAAQVAAAVGR